MSKIKYNLLLNYDTVPFTSIRKLYGKNIRTAYVCTCKICGNSFESLRKPNLDDHSCVNGLFCCECHNKIVKFGNNTNNNYNYTNGNKQHLLEHRAIIEKHLKRKLSYNEVIHHLDGDSKNNNLNNLIVLNRTDHNKLHDCLSIHGVIIQESKEDKNNWNDMIIPLTLQWLSINNISYIKF